MRSSVVGRSCVTSSSTTVTLGCSHPSSYRNPLPSLLARCPHQLRHQDKVLAPVRVWKKNSAEVKVPVPVDVCWDLWDDRPRIPEWMGWISSVTVQEDDDRLSLWSLETEQFGQTFKFSWFSKNLTPIRHRLIHWVSVDDGNRGGGLLRGFVSVKNKGEIQFRTLSEEECVIRLVISYELPTVLMPLADLLKPTVDGILLEYMNKFETVAKNEHSKLKLLAEEDS